MKEASFKVLFTKLTLNQYCILCMFDSVPEFFGIESFVYNFTFKLRTTNNTYNYNL